MSVEAVRKESIYEYLSSLSKPMPQHFVDNFDGDIIDSGRWTFGNTGGVGIFAMASAINEGASIIAQNTPSGDSELTFNLIRQYDMQSAVVISEFRRVTATNTVAAVGLTDGILILGSLQATGAWRDSTTDTFKELQHNNGLAPSATTASDVPIDLVFTKYQIIFTSTALYGSINGVLKVTATTDLPSGQGQPCVEVFRPAAVAPEIRIRYLEVFNL
jgi:hypothetical protein